MRKMLLWLAIFVLAPLQALALDDASLPAKFPIPWANTAGGAYTRAIPTPSQIGIQNCAASLTDGFPPLTFVPAVAGGCPPFGQDFNGILKQLTQWSRWQAAGAPVPWDSAFSAAMGGYPKGSIVQAAAFGSWWLSVVDNNTTNPDTGGANWNSLGFLPTGAIIAFGGSAAPPGFLLCDGHAVSRTTFAALFATIGTLYGAGDGSTTFNIPDMRGSTAWGWDTMGAGAANRITLGGSNCAGNQLGTVCGSQSQTLTQGQLPAITYNLAGTAAVLTSNQGNVITSSATGFVNLGQVDQAVPVSFGRGAITSNYTPAGTIGPIGSGSAHPILGPGVITAYLIKL